MVPELCSPKAGGGSSRPESGNITSETRLYGHPLEHQDPPQLSGASDWFPASQWSRSRSSASSSGRCSSTSSPVTEKHVAPQDSATRTSPKLLKSPRSPHKPEYEKQHWTPTAPPAYPVKASGVEGAPAGPSYTTKGAAPTGETQVPLKGTRSESDGASARAALVCGPLAVQKTLTERQLCIEKRMMELRQQNRRRMQRRQLEAKQQQQQRAKEQYAALLARRQRLKLASLWKERGMAAAARPPALSGEDAAIRRAGTEIRQQASGDSRSAEELLAALVISESISLQHADGSSENSASAAGEVEEGAIGSEQRDLAACSLALAACSSFAPFSSCGPSRRQETPEPPVKENKQLRTLLLGCARASSVSLCDDKRGAASPRCAEAAAGGVADAPDSASGLSLLLLKQYIQRGTVVGDLSSLSRPHPAMAQGTGLSRGLQRLLCHPEASSKEHREGPQAGDVAGALGRNSRQAGPGPSLLLQRSRGFPLQMVQPLGLKPGGAAAAPDSSYTRGVGHKVPRSRAQPAIGRWLVSSFQKPGSLQAPRGSAFASSRTGASGRQGLQRRSSVQPVVLVSAPHLKRQLELKLLQQRGLPPSQGAAPPNHCTTENAHPLRQQQIDGRASARASERPTEAPLVEEKDTDTQATERGEAFQQTALIGERRARPTECPLEPNLRSRPGSPLLEKEAIFCAQHGNSTNEQAKHQVVPMPPVEHRADMALTRADAHLVECTGVTADQTKTAHSEGAAKAREAGLQLVRVSRHIRGHQGDNDKTEDFLGAGNTSAHSPQDPSVQVISSSRQWRATRVVQHSQGSPSEPGCSVSARSSFASAWMVPQARERHSCCWVVSPEPNEAPGRSSRSSSKEPRGHKMQSWKQHGSLSEIRHEWKKAEDASAVVVRALEEAQQVEEERLLLLEVSHKAIEKEADKRRKARELQQQLRQQRQQSPDTFEGSLPHTEQQQSSRGTPPVLQPPNTLSMATEDLPTRTSSGSIYVARGKSFPCQLPLGPQHKQKQPQQQRQARQVLQQSLARHQAPLSVHSSFSLTELTRARVPTPPKFATEASSSESRKKPAQGSTLVHGNRMREIQDGGLRERHQEKLLQHQQALLKQLLQQCLSSQLIPEPGRSAGPNRSFLGPPVGWGSATCIPAPNTQRHEILQAIQGLLLLPSCADPVSAGDVGDSEDQRKTKVVSQHHQQQQNAAKRHLPATKAVTYSCGATSPLRRRRSYRSSSSYSQKTPKLSLYSDQTQLQQQERKAPLQQHGVSQLIARPSSPLQVMTGFISDHLAPSQAQAAQEQQQLFGPLIAGMAHRQPVQQQEERPQQPYLAQGSGVVKRENMKKSRRASTSCRPPSEVAHGRPP